MIASRSTKPLRTFLLHAALVAGAAVFFMPLYWLITTALKPGERATIFPPDLIPMQQNTLLYKHKKLPIYSMRTSDGNIKVAKLREIDSGQWVVGNVHHIGDTSKHNTVSPDELTPLLHPGLMWKNFQDISKFIPPEYNGGLVPLWNTVYLTVLSIIGTILSSSLVAFSFARLRWPGRDVLFVIMLATMMIPGAVTMLPVFLIYRWLGWIDTLKPLWVAAFFGNGFNIFLLRQFFLTIPNELEDAARIDGCSYLGIYWHVMLPLVKPALAALTVFTFMGTWNNFMGPLIYISSPEKMTISYALQLFQGIRGGEPSLMMAAGTLVMLPVMIVFFFSQRYMIEGVTLTGMKG